MVASLLLQFFLDPLLALRTEVISLSICTKEHGIEHLCSKHALLIVFMCIRVIDQTIKNLIDFDVIFPRQSSEFIKSVNFGCNLENLKFSYFP